MMYSAGHEGNDLLPPPVYLENSGEVVKLEYTGEPLTTLLAELDEIRDGTHPRRRFRQDVQERRTHAAVPAQKSRTASPE
ncbi:MULTISPECIES: hypothetical protein [unclassified Streptomyces]|uniref:hypothetical protein n=1 Tax=unclassified Streptomyces TaxID=2593676 RepID=UPI0033F73B79